MSQLTLAVLKVRWQDKPEEVIPVQFNPTEYTLDKQAQLAEVQVPGLDAPLQQYVRGQAEKLTVDLFFDTTDAGMGADAHGVANETDKIYQLIKIEPKRHAPPILEFIWSADFPGSKVGSPPTLQAATVARAARSFSELAGAAVANVAGAVGSAAGAAMAAVGAAINQQRRTSFTCVMESIKQKFTLFSPQGVPLRATLTVTLREYRSLETQLKELNLSSPDRTHVHVLQRGEDLSRVAWQYYDSVAPWREIARANGIEAPRRLTPGTFLRVPRLERR
jgi:nucleoid-associated protein YgaU